MTTDPAGSLDSPAGPTPSVVLDLPDVNVLVALLHPAHVHHLQAQKWFTSTQRFATTPITESGFIRMALNPVVAGQVTSLGDAMSSLSSVRADKRAEYVADDTSLAVPAIDLVGLVGFRQVTDFHLVNLAARHSARLVTFDRKIALTLAPRDRRLVHGL